MTYLFGITLFYSLSAALFAHLMTNQMAKPITVILVSNTVATVLIALAWISNTGQDNRNQVAEMPTSAWLIMGLIGGFIVLGDFCYGKSLAIGTSNATVAGAIAAVPALLLAWNWLLSGKSVPPMVAVGIILMCIGGYIIRAHME